MNFNSFCKYCCFCIVVGLWSSVAFSDETASEALNITPHSNVAAEDNNISLNAKIRLSKDPRILTTGLDVATNNGIVVLKANFNTLAEAIAAVEDISSVPGVVDVNVSSIVLTTGEGPAFLDAMTSAKIKGFFIRANALENQPFQNLNIETRDGHVILTGELDTIAQAKAAERIAGSVPGVKDVVSHIAVRFPY